MAYEAHALTQAQAAALIGVGARRLRQMSQEDNPPPQNENGQYPPEEFGTWMRKLYSHEGLDYAEERARLTFHQANMAELDEEVKRGTLIPADQVEAVWSEMAMSMRAKLLNLPQRLATQAIACQSIREIEEFARAEVYTALIALSDEDIEDTESGPIETQAAASPSH